MSAHRARINGHNSCSDCGSARFIVEDGRVYCADCEEPWDEDDDVLGIDDDEDDIDDDEDEEGEDECVKMATLLMNSERFIES